MAKTVVVVGAGICGVSTAIWLQRAGHRVLLIDKGAPGSGASYGNSGLLAHWAVDPVSSPTLWREAPGYLLDRDGPLFLKWLQLPQLLPWLGRFMAHANDASTRRIVDNLNPLLYDTVAQHRSLVHDTPLDKWLRDSKFSFAYASQRSFEADAYSWQMKALAGLQPRLINGPAVREEEPMLSDSIGCLAVLDGQGHITDPGRYVAGLAEHFTDRGGRVVQAEVEAIVCANGSVTQVQTATDVFRCDCAVITAGIWSKDLMKTLGLRIPLVAERGYHIIFENPSQLPRNPMLICSGKFGVNAMDMGLRCSGTVELGDHHAGPGKAPLQLLLRQTRRAFPDLEYSATREWMGFRPSLPDSTPLIGELTARSGIYVGFGHQHIGITSGPKTGRLLAQLIDGQTPNMDMSAYAPGRYRV